MFFLTEIQKTISVISIFLKIKMQLTSCDVPFKIVKINICIKIVVTPLIIIKHHLVTRWYSGYIHNLNFKKAQLFFLLFIELKIRTILEL